MDAFGQLSLCLSARTPSYDLREGRFEEAWQEFFPFVLALEYQPDFECLGCPFRMICSQCPAIAMTEMGDPQIRVPFICQLAHLRAEAFDK